MLYVKKKKKSGDIKCCNLIDYASFYLIYININKMIIKYEFAFFHTSK